MILEFFEFVKKEPLEALVITSLSGGFIFFFSQVLKALGVYLRNQLVTIITVGEQHWFFSYVDSLITSLIINTRYRCFELSSTTMQGTKDYDYAVCADGVERDMLGNRKDLGVSLVLGEGRCLVKYEGVWYYIYKFKNPPTAQSPSPLTTYFIVGFSFDRKKALKIMTDCFDNAAVEKEIKAFYNGPSGCWYGCSGSKVRSLESVVCNPGIIEGIVEKLNYFYKSKQEYARLGRPYKVVFCLEGPPGTGKTSIIKAVATHFQKHLYCLALDDLHSASDLYSLLSNQKGIVVIEDIGKTSVAVNEDSELINKKITLATLFQAFDGILSPEGCVIFCTTNDYGALDSVLKRDLRFDMVVKIDLLERQAQKKLAKLYGINDYEPVDDRVAGATLAKQFDKELI